MFDIEVKSVTKVPVKYLKAMCGVRYWEDAKINGVEDDENGTRIPCKSGDMWAPTINLETGVIEGWPAGTVADIHYKVCDAGEYHLLDEDKLVVISQGGYVPSILSPGGDGWGDYVIMHVHPDGGIAGWSADLSYFEDEE